jgi:hypothetical protein
VEKTIDLKVKKGHSGETTQFWIRPNARGGVPRCVEWYNCYDVFNNCIFLYHYKRVNQSGVRHGSPSLD